MPEGQFDIVYQALITVSQDDDDYNLGDIADEAGLEAQVCEKRLHELQDDSKVTWTDGTWHIMDEGQK